MHKWQPTRRQGTLNYHSTVVYFSLICNLTYRDSGNRALKKRRNQFYVRPSLCIRLSVMFICCSSLILLDCSNLIKCHKASLAFSDAKTISLHCHYLPSERTTEVFLIAEPLEGLLQRAVHTKANCLTSSSSREPEKCLTGCWNWKSPRPTQVKQHGDQHGGFWNINRFYLFS